MKEIIRLFPDHFQLLLKRNVNWKTVQEIRLRVQRKIEILDSNQNTCLSDHTLTSTDLSYVLNQISQFSLYRFKDQLKDGFITIEGGHRVGLSGKVNTVNDQVDTLKHVSFMNIRVARSTKGYVEPLLPYLHKDGRWASTMIIGPPHSGKTTLLRELARTIGSHSSYPASKVAIVDERSEIAASLQGVPQLEVGTRTDVMDACPKAEGMMMMIRSMSPEVIVVDEIGGIQDANAIREAAYTGVEVLCSIHGSDFHSVQKRPSTCSLIDERVFHRYLVLERLNQRSSGSIKILDENGYVIAHIKGRVNNGVDRSYDDPVRNNVGRV
ncbi:stage III sporulation protein AA [Halobacillus sp. BBL2006]|uniref:stage III sporulation protein AA n=1 Tax=Halobacillus sp. BBL2006 TaxID=1543706 RepID=UPI0005423187|nr:stage III sporulation protein AA [Halobacillus sp. BBL2006]KHE69171.1 stage III sporulation protein AA [Halobacillus sp. BBL2006]